MADRVTAVGEVIRTELPNGLSTNSGYNGTIKMLVSPSTYRNLARTEGSFVPGTAPAPARTNRPGPTCPKGTYNSNIMNGGPARAGSTCRWCRRGRPPIDLIRRPARPNENTANPSVYQQRFYSLAGFRILLSD